MIQNLNFTLFGNYEKLEATPDIISQLLTEMIKNGLSVMPGTFQQINPGLGMKKFERMQFNNQKDNLSILFNVDSIQISSIKLNEKSYNLNGNIHSFVYSINKVLSSLSILDEDLSYGNRASLGISILHDSEKIKPLNEIYEDFSNKIPLYDPEETFEWNSRAAKRQKIQILEFEEEINIVSEVMRNQGEIDKLGEKSRFDTMNTVIEINTIQENQKERIESKFVKKFLETTSDLIFSQYKTIEVKLNVNK